MDCTYCAFDDNADFTLENDFIYKKDKDWLSRILECLSNINMKWKFIPADEDQKEENIDEYVNSKVIIDKLSDKQLCYDEGEIEEALDDESYEYDARDISCISLCLPCDADDMHSKKGLWEFERGFLHQIYDRKLRNWGCDMVENCSLLNKNAKCVKNNQYAIE